MCPLPYSAFVRWKIFRFSVYYQNFLFGSSRASVEMLERSSSSIMPLPAPVSSNPTPTLDADELSEDDEVGALYIFIGCAADCCG